MLGKINELLTKYHSTMGYEDRVKGYRKALEWYLDPNIHSL
jgi:hypothetical protein